MRNDNSERNITNDDNNYEIMSKIFYHFYIFLSSQVFQHSGKPNKAVRVWAGAFKCLVTLQNDCKFWNTEKSIAVDV